MEKLGLVKEVNQMKQLNSHLENRLQEQEKRLCLVTTELGKTWHVVSKLRRQHYQLHTHEKILKYELQQKRKLLNELKEELAYCREKWDEAREKNSQSERDWKVLRAEFTSRKMKSGSPSFNNSGESGYSDERPSDESSESNDESEYVSESTARGKKKVKKSFETIFDSSNDLNCAAEREDPVSDLLDVAELPLDAHDADTHGTTVSERSVSENLQETDKTCETEDEICEIIHDDSVTEEVDTAITSTPDDPKNASEIEPSSSSLNALSIIPLIEPSVILKNIRDQNERLAKKDERLNNLEKNSSALLEKSQATNQRGQDINNTLDQILSRPSTSLPIDQTVSETEVADLTIAEGSSLEQGSECSDGMPNKNEIIKEATDSISNEITDMGSNEKDKDTSISEPTLVDFKTIMANCKRQNELLVKKDQRLDNLERECAEVVGNLTSTLNSGQNMVEKLENLHNNHEDTSEASSSSCCLDNKESEPSSSTDVDHEARFAARDIRLKRLEEQTKSLVSKMNKTNSKGVKIHYKLQELHSIYGSENSRAGTPSEENADRSNDEDNDQSDSIDENP